MLLFCFLLETAKDFQNIEHQFSGICLVFALTTSLIIVAFQKLTIKQLLENCTKPSKELDSYWAELHKRFGERISTFVYRTLVKSGIDHKENDMAGLVNDLTQDIYMLLLKDDMKAILEFKGETDNSFSSYLYTISQRHVQNYLRKERKRSDILKEAKLDRSNVVVVDNDHQMFSNSTKDDVEEAALVTQILKTLLDYPSQNRERDIAIFILYALVDMHPKEICNRFDFGLTTSGIETRVSRIKDFLRNKLSLE